MAINSSSWDNEGTENFENGTLELLYRCKVEKLLIVVGAIPFLSPQTVFVDPNNVYPIQYEKKFLDATTYPDNRWSTLETNVAKAMQNFKDQRAIDRKEECKCKFTKAKV